MTFDQLLIAFRRLRTEVEDIRRRLRAPLQQASSVSHGGTTSPDTLGDGTEGSETADTGSWTWSNGGPPLELWVVSRLNYNEAGDQKLYMYLRKITVDDQGFFNAASSETRVIVDTPEA